jgi:very-long-chain ceramide synthase
MNTAAAPEWLPSVLVPFFTLSYPTPRPASPDSYLDSEYFNIGRLDGCFIVTCIAVMAIARDVSRIFFLEPFARWKLSRDVRRRHKILASNGNGHHVNGNGIANGKGLANGNGKVANGKPIKYQITQKEKKVIQHSVTRFAEQGWAFIYYILQWSYGLVC